jgi:hypothetical protein
MGASAPRRLVLACPIGPWSTLETHGESNAISSLFVVDKRLRLTQRECWSCVVGDRSSCRQHRRDQRPGCIGQICIVQLAGIDVNGITRR